MCGLGLRLTRGAERSSVVPRRRYVAFIGWAGCMIIGTIAIPHIYNGVKVCRPHSLPIAPVQATAVLFPNCIMLSADCRHLRVVAPYACRPHD